MKLSAFFAKGNIGPESGCPKCELSGVNLTQRVVIGLSG